MSENKFPHHSGGVLKVEHRAHWGAVPESLLEDERLDLDTRAVAAWLAIRPPGWQISINAMRNRLGRLVSTSAAGGTGYKRRTLGKERWQRIAIELEASGYLERSCLRGSAGQWQWHIVFDPTSRLPAKVIARSSGDGSAGAGLTGPGSATHGSASTGKAGDKGLPTRRHTKNRTTTTGKPQGDAAQSEDPSAFEERPVVVIERCAEKHRPLLVQLLGRAELDHTAVQQIADELAGVLDAAAAGKHVGVKSVRGWVNRVIRSYQEGTFLFEFGRSIEERRLRARDTPSAAPTEVATGPIVAREHLRNMRVALQVGASEREDRPRTNEQPAPANVSSTESMTVQRVFIARAGP